LPDVLIVGRRLPCLEERERERERGRLREPYTCEEITKREKRKDNKKNRKGKEERKKE
jgi:hypothetical protein